MKFLVGAQRRLLFRGILGVMAWWVCMNAVTLYAASSYTFSTYVGPDGPLGYDDGNGSSARFNRPTGVAADSAGNVYIADRQNNTIRRMSPTGVVTTFAGTFGVDGVADGVGAAAQFSGPYGLAVDTNGNVYVSDTNNYTIRKITPNGVVSTLAGQVYTPGSADGAGTAANFNQPHGIAVDSAGNLYVVDAGNSTIRKITPAGVVSTLAGSAGQTGLVDGPGATARFNLPIGIAIDSSGTLYVADDGNQKIRKITPGGIVSTPSSTLVFQNPSAITVDSSGNYYIVDKNGHAIYRVTAGGAESAFAGSFGAAGSADGTGVNANFQYPSGITADPSGNLYVADTENCEIRKITPAAVVTTRAGIPPGYGTTNGSGANVRFNFRIGGMAVDSTGILYLADSNNQTIRKIPVGGIATTVFAGQENVSGNADGTGTGATFSYPDSVAVDSSLNVYVADTGNNLIRKITSGGTVITFAGSGAAGSANGQGTLAQFNSPQGIAVDSSGNVYVADTGNSMIRKITPGGAVSTLAGTALSKGSTDGPGVSALFNMPIGIAVDSAGNVYVADTDNDTIRKIAPGGTVSTLAGSVLNPGSADGSGAVAQFFNPQGICVDATGTLFVSDTINRTIRKITSGGIVTTIGGLTGVTGSVDGTGSFALFAQPASIAVANNGALYVTDTLAQNIRVGTQALNDVATVDAATGTVGSVRQLDTVPQTATSWSWVVIRRPVNSTAVLSSSSIRNPTFPPDVTDTFIVRLKAQGTGGTSITNVALTATIPNTTIAAANTLISFSSSAQNAALSALVTSPSATINEGNVTFQLMRNGAAFGSPVTSSTVVNGAAGVSMSIPAGAAPGAYMISATYSGTANFASSSDATHTLAINALQTPVITLLSTDQNPAYLDQVVTYAFSATDSDLSTLNYTFDFGDGSPLQSGTFQQGTIATVSHPYSAYIASTTVTLTVTDGFTPVMQTALQSVPIPASTGTGVPNTLQGDDPVMTPLTVPMGGLSLAVANSNGGVIQLAVDDSQITLARSAYDLTTIFGDISNRSTKSGGSFPVHQYINHGIFVATSTANMKGTSQLIGKARLTIPVSSKETGDSPHIMKAAADNDSKITTKSIKGKFAFNGFVPDTIAFSGTIKLPAGLTIGQPHEFWVAIGNIVVQSTIDGAGKGIVPGTPAVLKTLKLSTKAKKGTVTTGIETATVTVYYKTANMVANGADTEGINANSSDVANGATAPRNIQVAFLIDGSPYQLLSPVTFALSRDKLFGTISGRSSK